MRARDIPISDIEIPRQRMRHLRPATVDELAESFDRRGQLQAIILRPKPRGGFVLVAGRHRVEAARRLEHDKIRAEVRDGLDADAALLAEIDENLVRADLSPAEQALHVRKRKALYEKLHPETKRGGDRKSAKAKSIRQIGDSKRFTKDAAKKTGKAERTIQRDASRAKIANLVDVIGTSLDQGEELDTLAKLPEREQRKLIKPAKAGEKVTAKHAANRMRREARERELADATKAASKALGEKRYGVIYADPAWNYEAYSSINGLARAPQAHYPTMTTEEICTLSVPAAPDCVLFLWTTTAHLPDALEVMRAWGFEYRTHLIWKKDKIGLGYWFRANHELLFIGIRGKKVPAPAPTERPLGSVVEAPRGRHSEKPEVFAQMIERLFPNVPKIELFARKARPGWDVWGNEVPLAEAAE
jgi:N6-adenosine-specific RNA methylase IME4/ParB-like chromosome segregation protein Spo0J